MKAIKSTLCTIIVCTFISLNYQCASSKLKTSDNLIVYKAYYSEWYAGLNVGGTGFNIYFPNLNSDKKITIDSVYFRNLEGKLVQGRGLYSAILKHPTKTYENINKAYKFEKKASIGNRFSTSLKPNECIIKYFENGIAKYQKVSNIVERMSVFYKDGPPDLQVNHHIKMLTQDVGVANIDDDND